MGIATGCESFRRSIDRSIGNVAASPSVDLEIFQESSTDPWLPEGLITLWGLTVPSMPKTMTHSRCAGRSSSFL